MKLNIKGKIKEIGSLIHILKINKVMKEKRKEREHCEKQ
jgi:hypothetical protein